MTTASHGARASLLVLAGGRRRARAAGAARRHWDGRALGAGPRGRRPASPSGARRRGELATTVFACSAVRAGLGRRGISGSVAPPTRVGPEPTHADVASSSSSSSCSGSSRVAERDDGHRRHLRLASGCPRTAGCVPARRGGASPTSGDDSSTIGCASVGRRCAGLRARRRRRARTRRPSAARRSAAGCATRSRRAPGDGTGAGPSTSVSTESARSMSSAVGFSNSALGAGAGRCAFMPVVERGRPKAPELSSGTLGSRLGRRRSPRRAARRPDRATSDVGASRVPKGSEPIAGAVVPRLRARTRTGAGRRARRRAAGRRAARDHRRAAGRSRLRARAPPDRAPRTCSTDGARPCRPRDPGLEGAPACSRRVFSARIFSSTGWLAGVSLSKRTPMPGVTPARVGSFSRIQTIVPSPASSGAASCSWKSKRSCVPTGSGSRVRMKMPPRLTSTA